MHGPPAELRTRLIQAAYEAAVAEGRYEAPQLRRTPLRARLYRDGRLTLLAPYFDYAYYAETCPEFSASGLDELEHYNFFGWRRRRNPTAWFDTAYYLDAYPDVRASGDNPFWHYIFKGRAEGRAPQRPRDAERKILENLAPPDRRVAEADDPARLKADDISGPVSAALADARGFAYLVGEDIAVPAGWVRLQAAPLRAAALVNALPSAWSQTQLRLDGEALGVATDAEIAKALIALRDALPPARAFVVRDVSGASVEGLLAVEAALEPERRLFLLDDFASLCPSSRLLRNDVAFCGAPPPRSTACGLCIYGDARRAQLVALHRLFHHARFSIVAPASVALELWRGATSLPYAAAAVAAPARLAARADAAGPGTLIAESQPVRVAFIGAATLAEGWPTYERILEACGDLAAYSFHHFGETRDLRSRGNLFSVETPTRDASLQDQLVERRIDLVVMAKEGPETFSPSALTALAAGCDVVALDYSGHAAELAREERRGRTFASADEALAFFIEGRAVAYARARERFPRAVARIQAADAAALLG